MERRIAGVSSPFPRSLRAGVMLLAAALLVVSGPGIAQGTARPGTRAQGGGLASADAAPTRPWTDPIGDLALSLDYDVDRIFRFVTDDIRYEPYPGILRGARGTLAAGAGNSVDKALLLAALLDAGAVHYRFARGPLDAATSTALLGSLSTDLDGARKMAKDPLARGLEQATAVGATVRPTDSAQLAQIEQDTSTVVAQAAPRLAATKADLDGTVTMIEDALQGAGVDLPSGTDLSLPPAESTAHTWVQVAMGPDWVDLDPTMAGSQPGAVLTKPAETLTALPDDLRSKIEFGVLVETMSGGQLTTNEVLTYDGYADALAETPVTFAQGKPSGFQSLGQTLGDLLGEGWLQYRPALFVGSQIVVADRSVAFPSGSGSDPFGTQASGAPAGPVEGEATAEWLEVRVTPPGAATDVARRTVFDRLPADLRASGQLTPSAVAPIQLADDGKGSADFLPMLGVRTFAVATGPTTAASVAAVPKDALGMFALAYHSVRDALGAELALDAGARTFVDGPNIAALTVDVADNGGSRVARLGLDILRRDQGVLPLTGTPIGAARSQLIAGVLSQLAERFAIEVQADPRLPTAVTDVGTVFEAAANQGIHTLVLQGSVPDTLPYGPAATSLIKDAVASGDVVVVPAAPVMVGDRERVGWWKVDPRTGVTTDVMDDGAGQSVGEYALIVDEDLGAILCEGAMARQVALAIIATAAGLGAYGLTDIYWIYEDGFRGVTCTAL